MKSSEWHTKKVRKLKAELEELNNQITSIGPKLVEFNSLNANLAKKKGQVAELEQALRNEVILDALVLKVSIHGLDQLQVGEREVDQLIRCFVLVQRHDQRPVKPIVAEQLELLRVVITRQCLLRTLHVEDVEEEVWVLVFHFVVEGRAVYGEVWR